MRYKPTASSACTSAMNYNVSGKPQVGKCQSQASRAGATSKNNTSCNLLIVWSMHTRFPQFTNRWSTPMAFREESRSWGASRSIGSLVSELAVGSIGSGVRESVSEKRKENLQATSKAESYSHRDLKPHSWTGMELFDYPCVPIRSMDSWGCLYANRRSTLERAGAYILRGH